ncbi:GTPase [Candidatus Nitrosotenuis chungbukensis]|uniref:GTPase n=1 Tax=Candidatus Nitrosotenuis chungbukensis TaxID=1353246 RepID=UPI003B968369
MAAYQFTTLTVVPGILDYRGARIQVLDLPGIIEGASKGKGLGKRILSVARNADLVLLILDVFQPYHENVLRTELNNIGIRLDQKPPNIVIEKAAIGGISIAQQVKAYKIIRKTSQRNSSCLWNHECKSTHTRRHHCGAASRPHYRRQKLCTVNHSTQQD